MRLEKRFDPKPARGDRATKPSDKVPEGPGHSTKPRRGYRLKKIGCCDQRAVVVFERRRQKQ